MISSYIINMSHSDFVSAVLRYSNDCDRYKFLICKNGAIIPKFSTHSIAINNNLCYFALTDNYWIYFFTEDLYNSMFDGWHGDHFTVGYFTDEEVSSTPELASMMKFHKTSYVYDDRVQQYRQMVAYCDFKKEDYLSTLNMTCYYTKNRISSLSTSFDEMFENDNIGMIKEFLVIGLDPAYSKGGSIKHKNKTHKIHTGTRGGKYIIVNKKKVYLKPKAQKQYQTAGAGPSNADLARFVKQLAKKHKLSRYEKVIVVLDYQEQLVRIVYEFAETSVPLLSTFDDVKNMQSQVSLRPQIAAPSRAVRAT